MKQFEIALALVGLVDAVSYMVVAPSIVFYVLNLGGTKEQYGLILSSFSFASFCAKPLLGWWSDSTTFRLPYVTSILLSTLGGVLYSVASAFPSGTPALCVMTAGRLLGGVGAANAALGFAYVAKAVPPKERTSVTSALTAVRIIGMAAGPGVNAFLKDVNFRMLGVTFDSLNSVGLVLVISNLIALVIVLKLLPEPKSYLDSENGDQKKIDEEQQEEEEEEEVLESSPMKVASAILSNKQVAVPFVTLYIFNANFQVIETALAPAANDALNWGPVQTSAVMGASSFVIFAFVILVGRLSKMGTKDLHLLLLGLFVSAVGYALIWVTWIRDASALMFVSPVFVATAAFPFLSAPNRSLFTAAVDSCPHLSAYSGTMQALLSMASSIAGFTAPNIVATFFLRHPEDIDNGTNGRELSAWSLLSPLLTILTFFLVLWAGEPPSLQSTKYGIEMEGLKDDNRDKQIQDETTQLLTSQQMRKSVSCRRRRKSLLQDNPMVLSYRAESAKCMGLNPSDNFEEELEEEDA